MATRKMIPAILHNHESSNHNQEVQARYKMIRAYGDYHAAKEAEPNNPLMNTKKRNYTVLNPNSQGTTITTMPDDFVHYDANRSLTVREMARIQSFDDSFVFQGKRATGGDKRKVETPQFTQVGSKKNGDCCFCSHRFFVNHPLLNHILLVHRIIKENPLGTS